MDLEDNDKGKPLKERTESRNKTVGRNPDNDTLGLPKS